MQRSALRLRRFKILTKTVQLHHSIHRHTLWTACPLKPSSLPSLIRICNHWKKTQKIVSIALHLFLKPREEAMTFQFWSPFRPMCHVLNTKSLLGMCHRVCSRFFHQVGHETMYPSSGDKHFFTRSIIRLIKIMNRADKNYAQYQEIKYLKNRNFQKEIKKKKILLVKYSSQNFFFLKDSTNS